ncbi:DUF2059 domain-containing protein [Porticoccus sp. W117]|uniref:DUF2059 domain-containing protein n=1 Tax=Porticoccus sp. W117 TaxID=3054777 RepID=UPI002599EF09|nr:DUF2059 domain-containing protein [Porticoccus sp. W117]MDM3870490.1 DUF2059 domain-containing protein [Porticoccus sp. W117]
MKKSLFAFAFLLFSAQISVAADQARYETAERLMNSMDMQELLETSISQTLDMQLQQQPAMAPFRGVMLEFFRKYMSYESLKPDLVSIYAEAFSVTEMEDMIAFNNSPTGQKAAKLMPQLMIQGGQLGMQKVQFHMQELQQMVAEEMAKQQANQ